MSLMHGTDSPWRRRIARASIALAGLVVAKLAWQGFPMVFDRVLPQGPVRRGVLSGLLWVVFAGYAAILIVSVLAVVGLGFWLVRTCRPNPVRLRIARFLLLAVTGLLCLAMVEGMALALWSQSRRMPVLPMKFQPSADDSLIAVVIGSSSAFGYPYAEWFSIGKVVGEELEKALPGRRVDVQVLAQPGATLASMQERLRWLKRKPDLMIIYSGHNEFIARYSWWRYIPYYQDEIRLHPQYVLMHRAGQVSPFLGWLLNAIDRQRISGAPSTKWELPGEIVQNPVRTAFEIAELRDDFQHRLETIVTYCDQIDCLPVLLIPPGNDADMEPSRTVALPSTDLPARRQIDHELRRLRRLEQGDPSRAVDGYRAILVTQPTLAEAHYRLGKLLQSESRFAEAGDEFQRARDLDGMPLRCLSPFQDAYRAVARNHDALLIDGPAVMKELSPRRLLDDHAFNDGVHPSLLGHLALARAVLDGLRARQAFGWRPGSPTPSLDALELATLKRLDPAAWAVVCERAGRFYDRCFRIRFDPSERLAKSRRLVQAAAQIRAGNSPESLGIVGIGPSSPPMVTKSTEVR